MNDRKNKFLKIGRNDGFMTSTEDLSTLTIKKNNFDKILKSKKALLAVTVGGLILISLILVINLNSIKHREQCLNFFPVSTKTIGSRNFFPFFYC